jgi:2-hydroxychromene-2-carboxylate isomerase
VARAGHKRLEALARRHGVATRWPGPPILVGGDAEDQGDHVVVARDPGIDAVGLEKLIVGLPARALHGGLPSRQPRGDGPQILSRSRTQIAFERRKTFAWQGASQMPVD